MKKKLKRTLMRTHYKRLRTKVLQTHIAYRVTQEDESSATTVRN